MNLESAILQVPIEDIIPNRFQPRLSFDEKALEELSNSIKQHGIIQPLVLRKLGDKYEIIAGERRYKAATMAGLMKVPAVISNIDDNTSAEVALVENVQRKDLTPIEEAKSYKNILDKGYMTQEELSKKMGLSQSTIANKLRLLNLAEEVQEALLKEKISERHARALLVVESHDEQRKWLDRILNERLTVRQLDMQLKKEKSSSQDSIDTDENIPLVNINPDIEQIKQNASDINPVSSNGNLSSPEMLTTFKEEEGKMPNKFFNFLEDEEVNMQTEAPEKTDNFIFNPLKDPIEDNKVEQVLDIPPIQEPSEEIEMLGEDNDSVIEQKPIEMIPIVEGEDVVDPITVIESLDPEYEEKQKELAGLDLKTAITSVRNIVENLNSKGFTIDIEEVDLESVYQINIKINKE